MPSTNAIQEKLLHVVAETVPFSEFGELQRDVAAQDSYYRTLDQICDPCDADDEMGNTKSTGRKIASKLTMICCFFPLVVYKCAQAKFNYNETYERHSPKAQVMQ